MGGMVWTLSSWPSPRDSCVGYRQLEEQLVPVVERQPDYTCIACKIYKCARAQSPLAAHGLQHAHIPRVPSEVGVTSEGGQDVEAVMERVNFAHPPLRHITGRRASVLTRRT